MDKNSLDSFEKIMNHCGYRKCNKDNQTENNSCNTGDVDKNNVSGNNNKKKIKIDPTAGASTNNCRNANLDLLFGFQDADPMFLVVICEIVSNIISGKIPVNVAGAFGNWLQLIAQVMTLFNAQQQYQQSGPGRYYNPVYRNVTNPFCINDTQSDGGEPVERREVDFYDSNGKKIKSNSAKSKYKRKKSRKNKSKRNNNKSDIRELKKMINNMQIDIQNLKKEILNLKNNE